MKTYQVFRNVWDYERNESLYDDEILATYSGDIGLINALNYFVTYVKSAINHGYELSIPHSSDYIIARCTLTGERIKHQAGVREV